MRVLRILTILIAGSFVALAASAQSATTPAEESAVRVAALHEIDGWTKFDAAQIASCYTLDTTWQNPFGVRLHSRADLQKFLTNLFQRPGYRSGKDTSPARITDIHVLSPTTAVVWIEEKSEGQIDDATGKPMKPRFPHYLEVFTKKGSTWLISDSITMDEYPRP